MTRKTLTIAKPASQHISIDSIVERICSNCRVYDAVFGLCRKRSPYRDAETGNAVWPKVFNYDWCGDFKRLPIE